VGQHCLPLFSFAPQDEHERLMAIYAAAVYERGYAATRLSDIADLAGVPLEVVTARWPSEAECLLDTVAVWTRQLFRQMAAAFMDAAAEPGEAMHQALERMVTEMVHAPEMVHLSVVELPRLGPLVYERRRRMLDLFCDFLRPGFALRGLSLPDPEIVSLCIGGGLWRIVRQRAIERRLHELPEVLPAISYVCVSTFFDTERARAHGR
jgi:AcrR family transcriptional regulator